MMRVGSGPSRQERVCLLFFQGGGRLVEGRSGEKGWVVEEGLFGSAKTERIQSAKLRCSMWEDRTL